MTLHAERGRERSFILFPAPNDSFYCQLGQNPNTWSHDGCRCWFGYEMYNLAYAAPINRGKLFGACCMHSARENYGWRDRENGYEIGYYHVSKQFEVQNYFVLKMCLDTHTHNHLDITPLESIPICHKRIYVSVGPTSRFLSWMEVTFISLHIRVFVRVCIFCTCIFMFSQNFHIYRKPMNIL